MNLLCTMVSNLVFKYYGSVYSTSPKVIMKVQAAVFRKVGDPLSLEELELRKPLAGEVLVKLKASGICHSDLSATNGTIPFVPPVALGHEGMKREEPEE